LPPVVTPTPVPPSPGVVYSLDGQLWQVGDDWQPVELVAEPGDVLSSDGQRALRIVDGDIWLIALPGGQRFNLTDNSDRVHCCPEFWPGRPDIVIAGSWPSAEDVGPSTGHLTAVKFDLSEYRVLDEVSESNANFAPGPDGRTIAYDRGGTSWLYDWESGPQPLDPADFGLSNIARIAGPSWSPDGRQLAWTVAVTDPEWRIAVAVFDLDAGTAKLFHRYENIGRGGWFPPPVWSPDGQWLAFVTEDVDPVLRGVYLVNVENGAEIFAGAGISPVWSPDGRWLLVNPMDPAEFGAWLVEAGTWYPLQMYLPTGAQVVDWLP
jgi:Tol biopolymer transport system component